MLFDYAAEAGARQTVNELNRFHIDLASMMTPLQFREIADLPRTTLSEGSRAWIRNIRALSPRLLTSPRTFVRRNVVPQIDLYTDPRVPASRKSLLIAFCGNAKRLMLPAPVVLQALDAEGWDVVKVRKTERLNYIDHDGNWSRLARTANLIRKRLRDWRYRQVVCLGTSSGGGAALIVALLLNADCGVSVGGSLPPEMQLRLLHSRGLFRRLPAFRFAFSEDCMADRRAAVAVQARLGGKLAGFATYEKHNLFHHLVHDNRFEAEFSALIQPESRTIDRAVRRVSRLVASL